VPHVRAAGATLHAKSTKNASSGQGLALQYGLGDVFSGSYLNLFRHGLKMASILDAHEGGGSQAQAAAPPIRRRIVMSFDETVKTRCISRGILVKKSIDYWHDVGYHFRACTGQRDHSVWVYERRDIGIRAPRLGHCRAVILLLPVTMAVMGLIVLVPVLPQMMRQFQRGVPGAQYLAPSCAHIAGVAALQCLLPLPGDRRCHRPTSRL